MPLDDAVAAFVTLFVVVDPIGLAPVFLALTQHLSRPDQQRSAALAAFIAGIVLASFAIGGDWLLRQLGITLPAFRIAGGLLLFVIAFEMVYAPRAERPERSSQKPEQERPQHLAAFPLAIPLLAGPGAITATLLLSGRAAGDPARLAGLIGIIAVVAALCAVVFWFAAAIGHRLGVTGQLVFTRLLGILLASLAVQYVIDGVRAALIG